jgi:hypothetical protein
VDSVGLIGEFETGYRLARNGKTVLNDPNAFETGYRLARNGKRVLNDPNAFGQSGRSSTL